MHNSEDTKQANKGTPPLVTLVAPNQKRVCIPSRDGNFPDIKLSRCAGRDVATSATQIDPGTVFFLKPSRIGLGL